MVKVKNENDPFKPEYIIPQLLIETIICNNQKKMETEFGPGDLVWGVTYTSTHVNNEFPFQFSYLDNIALPVVLSDEKCKHCSVLASLFEISDPLCLEYETLKTNDNMMMWAYINPETDEERLREQYKVSKMGYMENRIRYFANYKQLPYLYFNEPVVVIGQRGEPVTIKVVSNRKIEVS